MLTAILTWLGTSGATMLLGFIGGVIKDMVQDSRNRAALEDKARAEAERDQARGTIAAQQAELDAAVTAPKTVDEAIKSLREGKE